MEARPVEVPEPLRVAVKGVDRRHGHRIDLRPKALSGRPEVGDAGGHRDPGAGQRDRALTLSNDPGKLLYRACYLPCHSGFRLPTKAPIPTRPSPDDHPPPNP